MNTFAERLRFALKSSGYTQKKVTEELGLSKNSITNYLNGRIPESTILYKMSKLLNVSMEWLISGNDITNKVQSISNLSEEEIHLITLYRKLTPRDRVKIEAIIEEKLDEPLGNKTEEKLLNSQNGERDRNVG